MNLESVQALCRVLSAVDTVARALSRPTSLSSITIRSLINVDQCAVCLLRASILPPHFNTRVSVDLGYKVKNYTIVTFVNVQRYTAF